MNRRRKIVLGFAAGALAAPLALHAQRQPTKAPRIGFLGLASSTGWASRVEALRASLRDLGYAEGRNLFIEFRWAEGKYDRLPGLALARPVEIRGFEFRGPVGLAVQW